MNRVVLRCMRWSVPAIVLGCALCAHAEEALEADPRPGALTLGVFGGEQEVYTQGDILLPLYRYDAGLLFINPRGAVSDGSEEEFNIGVGLRHIVDAPYPFMLGANVFYDARWSRHNNRFDQVGAGLEFLSEWVDARANYYWPDKDKILIDTVETESTSQRQRIEQQRQVLGWQDPYAEGHQILQDFTIRTTTRRITSTRTVRQTFERFEAALEGWDAELGGRLPLPEDLPIEMRVFGGYQHFDNPFGSSLKGWKGRLEVRALNGHLSLDAHVYENRELNSGDYLVGARVHVPFDLAALANGRNPFGGLDRARPSGLEGRLAEMVMRDPKIQTRESGYIEDESRRQETVSERNSTTWRDQSDTSVIADGVVFVHADRGNDANPGTAERPKETVQAGVENVFDETVLYTMDWPDGIARRVVYVFDADQEYLSGVGGAAPIVIDEPNIVLIGSGVRVPAYGGKVFGSGTHPRIAGAPGEATIRVTPQGDNTAIGGLGITTTMAGSRGIESSSGRIAVFDNHIWGTGDGLVMPLGGQDVESYIFGNLFGGDAPDMESYRHGIFIEAAGQLENDFHLEVQGNEFYGHRNAEGHHTVYIDAHDYGLAEIWMEDNTLADNDYGMYVRATTRTGSVGGAFIVFSENDIRDIATGAGLWALAQTHEGPAQISLENNTIERTGAGLLGLDPAVTLTARTLAGGDAWITLLNNRTDENGSTGLSATSQALDGGYAGLWAWGNEAHNNSQDGMVLSAQSAGVGTAWVEAHQNMASGNAHDGIELVSSAAGGGFAFAYAAGNQTWDNGSRGLTAWAQSDKEAQVMALRNFAEGNGDWSGVVPSGWGLYLHAEGDTQAYLYADENEAHGNALYGIWADLKGSAATGSLVGNAADNNVGGIWLNVEADDADVDVLGNRAEQNVHDTLIGRGIRIGLDVANTVDHRIQNNVMRHNSEGMLLDITDAGPANYVIRSNSFDNMNINLEYAAPVGVDLDAQENWWGSANPDEFKALATGGGSINTNNWLAVDPHP